MSVNRYKLLTKSLSADNSNHDLAQTCKRLFPRLYEDDNVLLYNTSMDTYVDVFIDNRCSIEVLVYFLYKYKNHTSSYNVSEVDHQSEMFLRKIVSRKMLEGDQDFVYSICMAKTMYYGLHKVVSIPCTLIIECIDIDNINKVGVRIISTLCKMVGKQTSTYCSRIRYTNDDKYRRKLSNMLRSIGYMSYLCLTCKIEVPNTLFIDICSCIDLDDYSYVCSLIQSCMNLKNVIRDDSDYRYMLDCIIDSEIQLHVEKDILYDRSVSKSVLQSIGTISPHIHILLRDISVDMKREYNVYKAYIKSKNSTEELCVLVFMMNKYVRALSCMYFSSHLRKQEYAYERCMKDMFAECPDIYTYICRVYQVCSTGKMTECDILFKSMIDRWYA